MDWLLATPLALWLAVGGLLLAAEVASGSGWLLWPAGAAALTAAVAALMPLSLPLQAGLFAVLTIVATLTGRHFFPRRAPGHDINDTLARLADSEGVVTQSFQSGSGRVLVDGKEWAAKLDGGATLASGAKVIVTAVGGAQLHVRAA
jgi:membrane protein implicated in regulation of membrane protease activity